MSSQIRRLLLTMAFVSALFALALGLQAAQPDDPPDLSAAEPIYLPFVANDVDGNTPTLSSTQTASVTITHTDDTLPPASATASRTVSASPSQTATRSLTSVAHSPTLSPSSEQPSLTSTIDQAATPSATATDEVIPSATATDEVVPTATDEVIPTATATDEVIPSATATDEVVPTATEEGFPSATPTASNTDSPTETRTHTSTPTSTVTATPSNTATITPTFTPSNTPTPTPKIGYWEGTTSTNRSISFYVVPAPHLIIEDLSINVNQPCNTELNISYGGEIVNFAVDHYGNTPFVNHFQASFDTTTAAEGSFQIVGICSGNGTSLTWTASWVDDSQPSDRPTLTLTPTITRTSTRTATPEGW